MDTEVAVVGAGPTGLLLAGDLAETGVAVTLVERRDTTSSLTRAFAVHARTLEHLDARGLADDLIATGRTVDGLRVFSGIDIDLTNLPTRFPFALVTPQSNTEGLLESRARDLGVSFEVGAEVTAVHEIDGGVRVCARRNAEPLCLDANYVVGADGVHSRVRRSLGLAFPGRSAVRSVMLADVRLAREPRDVLTVDATKEGFAFMAPFGDGWHRIIAWDRHDLQPDSAPVSLSQVAEITRSVLHADYGMHEARWLSRFHSDERQVESYRAGRIFLAGDAAHVHSPAGGQGMNTGLQDATNLGWKLATAIHGGGTADAILETYHAERHPIGRQVLRSSRSLLHLAMLRSAPARAARLVLGHAAVRVPPVMNRVAMTISGLAVSYDGDLPGAGGRAQDVALRGERYDADRLYVALRTGKFVWLKPTGARGPSIDHPNVVNAVAAAGNSYALVRPDGHYALRMPRGVTPTADLLRAAVEKWAPPRHTGATACTDKTACAAPPTGPHD